MKKTIVLVGLISFMALSTGVQAAEKKWADESELSFVDSGGNTDTTSLSFKNLLTYSFSEKLEGVWKLSALYGETDGERTAESYSTVLRANYFFNKRFYGIGMAGWEKDEFAGIEARYYAGPAVGYKFLMGPKHFLLGETGVDYVTEEYTDKSENSFFRGRVFGRYEYAFSEKTKFREALEFLYDFEDSDNYNINSETSLITLLSEQFSLKTSYEIKYDNKPVPATLRETDRVLSITLVVNF